MGLPNEVNSALIGAAAAGGYEIEQSLRYPTSSSTLTWTPSTTTNRREFTWSWWAKLASVTGSTLPVINVRQPNKLTHDIYIMSTNLVYINDYVYTSGGEVWSVWTNTEFFRDPGAWVHIHYTIDTAQASQSDRRRIWFNGVEFTGLSARLGSDCPQNYDTGVNVSGTRYFLNGQGYMAEAHAVDGQALDPTDFGEYNDDGVWVPKEVDGVTYGTNGWYLKFDPSATNGIGHDHSGNGNHFTASGFTTSGTGTDVMSDTPTKNWCTWNPLGSVTNSAGNNSTFSDGNLTGTTSNSATTGGLGTIGVSSGKWYFEITCGAFTGGTGLEIGVAKENLQTTISSSEGGGTSADGYFYIDDGRKVNNNSASSYGASYTNGDVISVLLDLDAGSVTFHKNGTSQGTAFTGLSGEYYPAFSDYNDSGTSSCTLNCGQSAFSYTLPSGYSALNTSNLPASDIADGSQYFNQSLWTGTGSPVAVTGVGFQPDFVWVKARSRTADHKLQDSLRGSYRYLQSNLTNGENTNSANDWFRSFDSDGFTVAQYTTGGTSTSEWAGNGDTYVGWSWLAGGSSGSSNTDGTITSTVSANPTAGFSIGTFTGTGSAGSIGHGLGVAPKFVLIKRTNVSGNSWAVYHDALGPNKQILLNSTNAASGDSGGFPSAPSSTAINVGTGGQMDTNQVGAHVFYAFAEVEGYSKFGSYTGNGNLDGPFIYCGFKPAWVMIKRTDGTGEWFMVDTARNPYNPADDDVFANFTTAETASSGKDLLSNGFKIRESGASMNASGGSFIFMAFAEHPFGGSTVSPATAR